MALNKRRERSLPILSKRLRTAYYDIPFSLRAEYRKRFCEVHNIVDVTLRQKINGQFSVTEFEVKWTEDYNPYGEMPAQYRKAVNPAQTEPAAINP